MRKMRLDSLPDLVRVAAVAMVKPTVNLTSLRAGPAELDFSLVAPACDQRSDQYHRAIDRVDLHDVRLS